MAGAELGLGLAAIGRPAYINVGRDADLPADRSPEVLRRRAHDLLDAAAGLGVNYVDAARSYGLAEEFLASWLRGRTTPPPFVASKWGYRYTAGWRIDTPQHEVKDHSAAMLAQQFRESHELLGPWLRLYQVHSLTLDSPLWGDPAVIRELAQIRASGVEVGLSTSGPEQAATVRRALDVVVDGHRLFSSVQSTWNLYEPSVGPALADAHAAGLRVVIKEVLANGRLTDRGVDPSSRLTEAARAHGVGVDVLALAAGLARPWCDVVLSGAVSVEQLAANMRALELAGDPDTQGLLSSLLEPQDPGEYWGNRSRLPWR
ncbi:aldo/keto reductase [Geodermatophilus ruber]|uniref:Predicted oxidoreductase n=1 Tax=Geodermatophilus ruber TaxID=504800 RepID=A0A1I4BQV3_9ACTN|nr:aldo/keto reductase [Geodermatophilus ruber]SFK70356.1 Predicted oxidoreductase [Geodermatophilus ruber]